MVKTLEEFLGHKLDNHTCPLCPGKTFKPSRLNQHMMNVHWKNKEKVSGLYSINETCDMFVVRGMAGFALMQKTLFHAQTELIMHRNF